jgi:hypothetical protein
VKTRRRFFCGEGRFVEDHSAATKAFFAIACRVFGDEAASLRAQTPTWAPGPKYNWQIFVASGGK